MKIYALKNGKILTVRPLEKKDANEMIQYLYKVSSESDFLTFGPEELNISLEKEEELIEEAANADNMIFIAAEIDGQIVGNLNFRGGLRLRTAHTGDFGISVLKNYYGLKIGTYLLSYLIDWAKENNIIKKINLRVREDNIAGIKLYKKLGFKEEGTIFRDFFIEGKFYSSIAMGLEIN